MIYYLAQKYSGCEEIAFYVAVLTTKRLRQMGKVVFSPILHTHPYDAELQRHISMLKDCYFNTDFTLPDLEEYQKTEDYVAWDLALCEGWLRNDYYDDADPYMKINLFDSGLTMLFASSCFDSEMVNVRIWASEGARKEYQWAKAHNVKCLLLEPFLNGEEVEV